VSRISPEDQARYTYLTYDGLLFRCEDGWPGERWLDGEWRRYEPTEEEFLRMRAISASEAEARRVG
jgi:hypothetical protein